MTDNLTPQQRSYCMSRIRSRDMKPELAVRSIVHRMGYRFRLHRRDLPGTPDLTLPRRRAVIFVHGCFWHWHPDPDCPIAGLPKSNLDYWLPKLTRTRQRDTQHLSDLDRLGWRTLVIWECQLRRPDQLIDTIAAFLGRLSPLSRVSRTPDDSSVPASEVRGGLACGPSTACAPPPAGRAAPDDHHVAPDTPRPTPDHAGTAPAAPS